jgi:hypothetical protein
MHERQEIYTKFKSENLKGTKLLEDLGVGKTITLNWILNKYTGCEGIDWLRTESGIL